MRFLREQLDDPGAADCGRCDNCGGLALDASISGATVADAEAVLERPGVVLDPRRMWPSAMASLGVDVRGKLGPSEVAEPGRAVARFTDLALGARVRASCAVDAPVPPDLIAASITVLAAWDWDQRPVAVAAIGSTTRPALVADFAAQLARIGRLTELGVVPHRGGTRGERSNSAHRLRTVWDAYAVPADLATQLGGELRGAPVLLVDDYADTGWTLAVVARLLRAAGAGAVYPFVLGQAG